MREWQTFTLLPFAPSLCARNTLPYIKNAYLWYAKIVSEKFAVTYSFSSPKDFQQTPNGNTAGKLNGILHVAVKDGMKFNSNLPT